MGTVAGTGLSMDVSYALTPFLTWLVASLCKFCLNSLRAKRLAFDLIGYGGLPSNHSAIVSSMAALIALHEGIDHPAFGVAVTLAFIVILDAHSLRRKVGQQAAAINRLAAGRADHQPLRERVGHTPLEIVTGIVVGITVAVIVNGCRVGIFI